MRVYQRAAFVCPLRYRPGTGQHSLNSRFLRATAHPQVQRMSRIFYTRSAEFAQQIIAKALRADELNGYVRVIDVGRIRILDTALRLAVVRPLTLMLPTSGRPTVPSLVTITPPLLPRLPNAGADNSGRTETGTRKLHRLARVRRVDFEIGRASAPAAAWNGLRHIRNNGGRVRRRHIHDRMRLQRPLGAGGQTGKSATTESCLA